MFTSIVKGMRRRIEQRQRYKTLTSEILSMSDRDLADIKGNRTDMLRHAYREIYG